MSYDVNAICKRFGVGVQTVLHWIKSGELKAVNVARSVKTRPQWRVSEKDLKEFEAARST